MNKKNSIQLLCEKMPYLAVLLAVIVPTILVGIGAAIGEMISVDAGNIGTCIAAVILMFIFKFCIFPEFKGFVKAEISAKDICIIMLPFIIYLILTLISPLFFGKSLYFNPTIKAIIMGLSAGFGEEAMFRIFSLTIVMGYVKKEKRLAVIILLAVLFGLIHLGNITQGADMVMSVVQMVDAIFMALLFTELYLMTGSVVFPIFAHGFYDYICFTTDPSLSDEGILVEQYSKGEIVYALILGIIVGMVALYLLSKNKMQKANELWDRKWQ